MPAVFHPLTPFCPSNQVCPGGSSFSSRTFVADKRLALRHPTHYRLCSSLPILLTKAGPFRRRRLELPFDEPSFFKASLYSLFAIRIFISAIEILSSTSPPLSPSNRASISHKLRHFQRPGVTTPEAPRVLPDRPHTIWRRTKRARMTLPSHPSHLRLDTDDRPSSDPPHHTSKARLQRPQSSPLQEQTT